jgi:L-amino acid N-acyltransferase YncA
MTPALSVRRLEATDWPAVEAIYREGIATGNATFEANPPTWEAFDSGKVPGLRLVAVDGERVLGWTAASLVSGRPVYSGVAEHSVYVAGSAQGRGVGRLLLGALIEKSESLGFWTLQSGVFAENEASLALHERFGFRIVGVRERLAKMTYGPDVGRWRDVLLVERRSAQIGNS